jgi:hypothetical protein
LDFAWFSTINRHLPDKISDYTKFPVGKSRPDLERALHGIEVDTRCKALFDCMVSVIQPYHGGNNSVIRTLHDLDISDKHLLLLELTPNAAIENMALRDESGQIYERIRVPVEGSGKYGIRLGPGIHVQNHGKLSFHVSLKDAGIFNGVPIPGLLYDFSHFVTYTVKSLESL